MIRYPFFEICLRCYSDHEYSEILTNSSGIIPTLSFNKGDRIRGKSGKSYGCYPRSGWMISKKVNQNDNISEEIFNFLSEYNINKNFISHAKKNKFDQIELFIGIFNMDLASECWIEGRVFKMLSDLNLDLGISVVS
jgi:hypothetical protein